MDYLAHLKGLDERLETENLAPNALAVYLRLLFIDNRLHWEEWFPVTLQRLQLYTGINSKCTITTAINTLEQKGFIEVMHGKNKQANSYKIVPFQSIYDTKIKPKTEQKQNANRTENGLKTEQKQNTNRTETRPIIRRKTETKTETETKDNNPLPPKGGVSVWDSYTQNPALLDALHEFEKMRKSIKKPMQDSTKQRTLKTLDKLAQTDEEKIAIVQQSVDHCWQGLYSLKADKPIANTAPTLTMARNEDWSGLDG